MITHPKRFGRYLLVVALAMLVAILLSGCESIIIANDQHDECRQCEPPESEDKAIGEYAMCQAYRLDKCRVLLGKKPEYKW